MAKQRRDIYSCDPRIADTPNTRKISLTTKKEEEEEKRETIIQYSN